jgi:hypothetical protein
MTSERTAAGKLLRVSMAKQAASICCDYDQKLGSFCEPADPYDDPCDASLMLTFEGQIGLIAIALIYMFTCRALKKFC